MGPLWAHDYEGERITVQGPTASYSRAAKDDPSLEILFCPACACVLAWRGLRPRADGRRRMAVNLRLAPPDAVADLSIAHFDGLDTFATRPPPAAASAISGPSRASTPRAHCSSFVLANKLELGSISPSTRVKRVSSDDPIKERDLRNLQDSLRRGAGDVSGWIAARDAELRQGVKRLEQAAEARRQAAERTAQSLRATVVSGVGRVIEAGANKVASRPAATPAPRPANTGPVSIRPSPPTRPRQAPLIEAGEVAAQFTAGVRGAQDAFTFGLGDHASAGIGAVGDALLGEDLGASYQSRMDHERALDAADAQLYGAARAGGQVLGVGAQVLVAGALLGPLGAVLVPAARGVRIAQAAPLVFRETAALAAAGAAAGAVGQAADDVTKGKPGTLGDYGGAVMGGTFGALVARRGHVARAGATAGLTQSVAQDTLNGGVNAQSAVRAREAAASGAAVAGVVGVTVAKHMDRLPMKAKELTGEHVSRIRNIVRGDKTGPANKTRQQLPGGGYTLPDLRTYRNGAPRELVESKFGLSAGLSTRQRQATRELDNYRVDHSTPRDIGAALGLPISLMFPWDWAMTKPQSKQEGTAP